MISQVLANPAQRRFLLRFAVAMSLYVVTILGVAYLYEHRPPAGALAYVLAVLAALPMLAVLAAIGRYFAEEHDEFQRNLFVQSQLWATGGTLAVTTFWGFLEILVHAHHLPTFGIIVLYSVCYGLAVPFVHWRHRLS